MAIFPRNILGVYLERERLQYCCAKVSLMGISLKNPGPNMEPQGVVQGADALRRLLEGLWPNKRYDIFLALPRGLFFVREMALPPMDLEEAWVSVQNSLSVYCHLPLEDIYHDVVLSQEKEGNFRALLFYIPRKEVDPILDAFDETGKRSLLRRIVPFSLCVYSWLLLQGYSFPMKLILPAQEGSYELGVYSKEGLLYSAAWPQAQGEEAGHVILRGLKKRFEDLNGPLYVLSSQGPDGLPPSENATLKSLPSIMENLGVAPIAAALSKKRVVSLDGRPKKIKQFRAWHLLLPVSIVVFVILAFLSWVSYKDFLSVSQRVQNIESKIQALQDKVRPLESRLKGLEESGRFYKDLESYIKERPDLYKVINEIARLVPEGTWFTHFLYEKGKITVRGTSKDALEVLNSLRKSDLFSQVKLVGSVSRNRYDSERFRIRIELKRNNSREK